MKLSICIWFFLRKFFNLVWQLPRNLVAFLIKGYQKTVSPDHGFFRRFYPNGYCKFHPTCSEYARECVKKHGLIWGGIKAFWRVCRCNPWSKGGNDPV